MPPTISLETITANNSPRLAWLLAHDTLLRSALKKTENDQTTATKDFLGDMKKWQSTTNSHSFAIILEQEPIGLISLSHQQNTRANIGYWIASKYWNRGYTTQAFRLLLEYARQHGFKTVSAHIETDNHSSIHIWKDAGAEIRKQNNLLKATLKI